MKSTISKEKIIQAVTSIPLVAKEEGWIMTLHKDDGTFFYAPETISDKSTLHQVTDEYAVYLDSESKPQGIVVEYYEGNFEKHHELVKDLSDKVFNDDAEILTVDPNNNPSKDVINFQSVFETAIVKDLSDGLLFS